ncbi:C-factor [Mycena maculata]|uniref:C-factor n=1 Tax=Mycena maculata TaxID=230809 RepID=A0AAD7K509_9AGAR|nr:C-factor [Mycena maculata]
MDSVDAEAPPESSLIVVTGASSGLGLAFFQHHAQDTHTSVIGVDRAPWTDAHGHRHARLRVGPAGLFTQLDITATPAELSQWAAREAISTRPVALVLHCAGVRGLVPAVEDALPHDVGAAETLQAMDAATMHTAFDVNVVGTLHILRALLPGLRLAAARQLRPKVVVMSSRMGSVSANVGGGGYAYRASKAALNAIVKSFSVDVPEVCFACVHPGRVETGLVKTREEGAISCEESLQDMLPLIQRLGDQSCCFVDRFGKEVPW